MTFEGALGKFALLVAPIRRFGGSALARFIVIVAGLCAMTTLTVPHLQTSAEPWLSACLWCCLGYFAVETVARAHKAIRAKLARKYFLSYSCIVDIVGIIAVPIALACGVNPPDAWLLASLWVLKLGQNSPALAQIGRVFVLEGKPLAGVFALFLIILILSSAVMYAVERDAQTAFNSMPQALWWAVVTLTTTGYGDKIPITEFGRLVGGFVMICGIATFGLSTGILATGFAAENRRQNFLQTWDLVCTVPFFQSLDPAAITEITHRLRRLEVPGRVFLIRRGRVGDCMYFIVAGEVQVDIKPEPVRLGPGAFFGELALLGDSVRSANVITTTPSTLLMLDLADFRTLTATYPDLKRAIDTEAERRRTENQQGRERTRAGGATPA